jgi:peroxiredoxin Q/BCP
VPEFRLTEGDCFPVNRLPVPLVGMTVVFFYPAALTGGWTREARRFDELHEEFREAGVEVVGASVDTAERNAEFSQQEGLGYPLASDPEKRLADELGILVDTSERGSLAARVTYLLDGDGTILKLWEVGPGAAIDAHPDEVLAEVCGMRR